MAGRFRGSVQLPTASGDSPLVVAAEHGQLDAAQWLVEGCMVPFDTVEPSGDSALTRALACKEKEVAAYFRSLARAQRAEAKRRKQTSREFFQAAADGNLVVLEKHLAAGFDAAAPLPNGWTALHEACDNGATEAVAMLLNVPKINPNAMNKRGWTPLHLAAATGRAEVVVELIKPGTGVDVARSTRTGDKTAVSLARARGHEGIAELIEASMPADETPARGKGKRRGRKKKNKKSKDKEKGQEKDSSGRGSSTAGSGAGSETPVAKAVPEPATPLAAVATPTAKASPPAVSSSMGGDTPRPGEPASEEEAVIAWLTALKLDRYTQTLLDEGFDSLHSLALVEEADLIGLGWKTGHRRTLLRAVSEKLLPALADTHDRLPTVSTASTSVGSAPTPTPSDAGSSALSPHPESIHRERSAPAPTVPKVPASIGTKAASTSADVPSHAVIPELPRLPAPSETAQLSRQDSGEASRGAIAPLASMRREYGGRNNPVNAVAAMMAVAESHGTSSDDPAASKGVSADVKSLAVAVAPIAAHVLKSDEMTFHEKVGEGSYGIVRRATWRGMEVAVKELRLSADESRARTEAITELRHEAEMMRRVCNHDHVIQFVGVLMEPRPALVTRFMVGGSLEDILVRKGRRNRREELSFARIVALARDSAAGVLHLHREGVIHRDLAARNILCDSYVRPRVADFGFSRVKQSAASKGYTRQSIGPIKYMSAEALRYKHYSEKSDVFSFGVVMYELFVGVPPWQGVDNMDVVVRVCHGERMKLPEDMPEALSRLIEHCWAASADDRPTMAEVHDTLAKLVPVVDALDKVAADAPASSSDPGSDVLTARSGDGSGGSPAPMLVASYADSADSGSFRAPAEAASSELPPADVASGLDYEPFSAARLSMARREAEPSKEE